MDTTLVQVRVNSDVKAKASEIFDTLGIDTSTAIRMFLKRVVVTGGIPFDMNIHTIEDN